MNKLAIIVTSFAAGCIITLVAIKWTGYGHYSMYEKGYHNCQEELRARYFFIHRTFTTQDTIDYRNQANWRDKKLKEWRQ